MPLGEFVINDDLPYVMDRAPETGGGPLRDVIRFRLCPARIAKQPPAPTIRTYRAANEPLWSVDDLFLIEGFDHKLVESLRPYVGVEPFAGGGGINLNTAPAHVLSLLYFNDGVDDRLTDEDEVGQILEIRAEGGLLCGESAGIEDCTPISSIVPNAIFPPPTYSASIFKIVANASVGDINRSIEAVINRNMEPPVVLSWRVR